MLALLSSVLILLVFFCPIYLQEGVSEPDTQVHFRNDSDIFGRPLHEPITTVDNDGVCDFVPLLRYETIARNMCLPTTDDRCLDGVFDVISSGYSCSRPDFFDDDVLNNVSLIDASSMMKLLQKHDGFGRSWCMISMFYAQGCPFSGRLAHHFNSLPKVFPHLKAVAIDATEFSRLNSRYGISGTPTVILWVNGVGVARMRDEELSMKGLKQFVQTWTNLEPRSGVAQTADEPLKITVNELRYVLLIILSWGMTITGAFYYFLTSEFGKQTLFHWFPRQRELYERELENRQQRLDNRARAVPAPGPAADPAAEPQPDQEQEPHPHQD